LLLPRRPSVSAVTVIPLFILSNLGAPMKVGGPPVIVVVFVGSLAVLALRRPRLPLGVAPVALVCVASLALVARPDVPFRLSLARKREP